MDRIQMGDLLNPIVIKELRQVVRGKFVVVMLMLLLTAQLFIIGLFLINGGNSPTRLEAGREIFTALLSVLLIICLLLLPTYIAGRLSLERSDTNLDLFFITTLKPRTIIVGKLLAALILTVLVFSACMPFMTFTYLLRGIDLPTIFILLACSFFLVIIGIQIAIFIGCIPTNRIAKAVIGVIIFFFLWVMLSVIIGGFFGFMISGIGSLINTWDFWRPACMILIMGLAIMGVLFFLSVAFIMPPSANRALPVRAFLTIAWLVTGVANLIWSLAEKSEIPIIGWGIVSIGIFGVAIFVAISEREILSRRVLRTLSHKKWLRLLVFSFYSGAANGLTWSCLMSGLTVAAFWELNRKVKAPWFHVDQQVIDLLTILSLYAFCYAMSGLFLRRQSFSSTIKPGYTWAIALILLLLGSIVPFLVGFFLHFDHWRFDNLGIWFVGNPFAAGLKSYQRTYLTFASYWAAIVAISNGFWFLEQLWSFVYGPSSNRDLDRFFTTAEVATPNDKGQTMSNES